MKRKLWTGLFFMALLFLFTFNGFAKEGSCGDGLTYTLIGNKLTITYNGSGTGEMTNYSSVAGNGTNSPWGEVEVAKRLTEIQIGDGVKNIGDYAFFYCYSLESITLPDSVTRIGEYAFSYCYDLSSITLSARLKSIGDYAFNFCESLTSITLPSGMETIEDFVFKGCRDLRRVEFPATLTSIGYYVFQLDDKLTDVYFKGTKTQWDRVRKDDKWRLLAPDFAIHFICTVTFNANGHGVAPNPKTNQWTMDLIKDPGSLTAQGYTFTGWYKDKTCTQKWDFAGDIAEDDMTLYAGWKANTVTTSKEKITITRKPDIKKPAAAKNRITVSWKHFKYMSGKTKNIWKKIKKVQVQCATDKGFKNIVKKMTVGKKKTKATIKGLKKNTTYYVRVRYFDGKGYSKWSSRKKVTTKK